MKNSSVLKVTLVGLMAAMLCLFAQLAIPMPWGISYTLQTFGVALSGLLLGPWYGSLCVLIYLLLGVIGLPVFTGFGSGPGILVGVTGGYLLGFLLMAFCFGLAKKHLWYGGLGLLLCHLFGVLQFSLFTGTSVWYACCIGTLPYLIKDVLSCFLAHLIARHLRALLPMEANLERSRHR